MSETKINIKKDYVKNPKAVIIIVHGIAEHLKRYDDFTDFLNKNKYSVIRYDQRGHGESSGEKGSLSDYNLYINDLKKVKKIAVKENPKSKIFLLGHSLGGISVNLYTALNNDVQGVITSGGVSGYVNQVKFLRFFHLLFFDNMKIKNSIKKGTLTKDKEIEEKYFNDPYVFKYFRFSLAREMLIKAVKKYLTIRKNITVPYLILHGKCDKIVNPKLSQINYDAISSKDKTLKFLENDNHEILNETDKLETYNLILNWLNERV